MNKSIYYVIAALLLSFSFSCKKNQNSKNFSYHKVIPAEFPQLNIPGFNFPEDSLVINKWIRTSEINKINQHGWGIWTGLTSETNQYIPGDDRPLRVFETWLTPEEMIDSIKNIPIKRSNRSNLKTPNQFGHMALNQETINDSIHESVAYSPGAASSAINNKIFMATTLLGYAEEGKKEVPFFPLNAITIKPVFKVLAASTGETSFNISAWHGPDNDTIAYPEQNWLTFVTVDTSEGAKSKGNTYSVNDFIHYKLNDEDAYYFNKEFTENTGNQFNAQPGDYVILMAMHVGTREITNWTWQTFWWDSKPNNPPLPSSKEIADARPSELKGAARNYAMAQAYYMINPDEPYVGIDVKGEPNYAYNPYLEAGFGPSVFDKNISQINTADGKEIPTYSGVRTNCMSCHRMATVDPATINDPKNNSKTPYVGNSYVSRTNPIFKDQLLLDFSWSIQGNIDTTGVKAYLAKLKK
jgi:hypothetical protein